MPMTSDNNPPENPLRKSRLDREVDEILASSQRHNPLPPPTPIRPNMQVAQPKASMPPQVLAACRTPILQALACALLAWIVRDVSPLLASVLAFGAIVCIILPIVRGSRPSTPSRSLETRMWRGQVIDMRQPSTRTPLDSLRDWWNARHR